MESGKFTRSRQSQARPRLFFSALVSLLALLSIVTCGKGSDREWQVVTVRELSGIIESGKEIFLLDVRTRSEYEQAHLAAADDLIPYDQLKSNLDRLPKNKNAAIYCFCRVGHRSGIAAGFLASIGFKNVYNVEGGMTAWKKAGFEVISGP